MSHLLERCRQWYGSYYPSNHPNWWKYCFYVNLILFLSILQAPTATACSSLYNFPPLWAPYCSLPIFSITFPTIFFSHSHLGLITSPHWLCAMTIVSSPMPLLHVTHPGSTIWMSWTTHTLFIAYGCPNILKLSKHLYRPHILLPSIFQHSIRKTLSTSYLSTFPLLSSSFISLQKPKNYIAKTSLRSPITKPY